MRPEQRPAVERVERIRHRPTGELSTRNPRLLEGSRVLTPWREKAYACSYYRSDNGVLLRARPVLCGARGSFKVGLGKPVATEAPGQRREHHGNRKPCTRRGFTYVRTLVEKRSLLIGGEGLETAAKGESPR
jgi:hypothetical protein